MFTRGGEHPAFKEPIPKKKRGFEIPDDGQKKMLFDRIGET